MAAQVQHQPEIVFMTMASAEAQVAVPGCRYLWRQGYNISIRQVYEQINDPIVRSSSLQQLANGISSPRGSPTDFVDFLTTCEISHSK